MNVEVVIIIRYDLYVQHGREKQNNKEKNWRHEAHIGYNL